MIELVNALARIQIANGFNTDLGLNLKFGAPDEAAEYDVQSLFLIPVRKRIILENTRWTHYLHWDIEAVLYGGDPMVNLQNAEADVWRALNTDPLKAVLDNLRPDPENTVNYEIETQGKRMCRLTIAILATVRTLPFAVISG